MSPFALLWVAVDLATLVPVVAVFARRDRSAALDLRLLLAAQVVVLASAIVAASTSQEPLHAYGEWTLMVAVNLGYALTSRTGGAVARVLGNTAVVATMLAVVLITLKSFSSMFVIAIGLVFAVGALLAAFFHVRELENERSRAGVDASSSL